MLLRSSGPSPFGRKVKMAAKRLGLLARMEVVTADTTNPDDPLMGDNPLGKIPLLVLDDGRRVYDSRVILECLDHMAGGGVILPRDFDARLAALTQQALADGVLDAALLVVYEGRFRPAELAHKPWVDRQLGKISRGLAAFERDLPDPAAFTVGTLTLACALGYLDLRKPLDWRPAHPGLVAWLEAFRALHPEYDATAAA
jgi:glutathione S-transferase